MITPAFGLTATERVLPRLALDFTTALLDPRITFTRTTGASNPATYVNSNGLVTLATNNQPRFDYNPIALVCRGLLIEESRTNSLQYAEDFTQSVWSKVGATISANAIEAPDGNTTADKLVEDTSTGSHRILATGTNGISLTSGLTYTVSFFVKNAGRDYAYIRLNNAGGDLVAGNVRLSDAAVTQTLTGTITATTYLNGWVRIVGTGTSASTSIGYGELRASNSATYASYTGDGTSGLYLWGAQLEAGSFATSYIPTTTTALTRNADVATMTGTNFSDWYNAGAGGVVARVLPSTVSGTRPALQFDDATVNDAITLRGVTTNPELVIIDGGSPQAQIDAGTIAANTAYNLGAAWNINNCAASVNGGAAVTDNSATIPTATQARLGSDGSNYLNGHLQTLRYWPQRIINAEMQAFSK